MPSYQIVADKKIACRETLHAGDDLKVAMDLFELNATHVVFARKGFTTLELIYESIDREPVTIKSVDIAQLMEMPPLVQKDNMCIGDLVIVKHVGNHANNPTLNTGQIAGFRNDKVAIVKLDSPMPSGETYIQMPLSLLMKQTKRSHNIIKLRMFFRKTFYRAYWKAKPKI